MASGAIWTAYLLGRGALVSGGSIANLTALTVARDQMLDDNTRAQGVAYISDQTHFCVPKALYIIGFLKTQIRVILTDDNFRMDLTHLQDTIKADLNAGLHPFLVVATCGTTNTGTVDPLHGIADIAHTQRIWVHVDGAYGASAAFCKTHRSLVDGLGRADSIAWDTHKWLFQTNGCSAVLFRNRNHPLKSFAATAGYVQDIDETPPTVETTELRNPWNYGIELTKPARHMKLWFTLQVLGLDMIDRMITHGFHLTKLAQSHIRTLPD